MPYIKTEDRKIFDPLIKAFDGKIGSAGELNYIITKLVQSAIEVQGPLSYSMIAGTTGVLENVKQELYRRLATPYEDMKKLQNGDVY